jgi:sigma-B regulation protein RsbU (phosphoserine phosphatase)
MKQFYSLRARMLAADLWPQGWVARGALYSLAFATALFALQMGLKPFAPAAADSLAGWVKFLAFDAALLFSIVAFRWLKRKILWRLRNRLIVTYVFIGVIPAVLLMVMALITLYGFAGQFAIFVVTSEINSQLRNMEAVNAAVGNELAARLEHGDNATVQSLAGLRKRDAAWSRRRMSAWHGDTLLPLGDESKGAPLSLPASPNEGLREITRDQGTLYLRVVTLLPVGSKTLVVVTSEPLDRELVGKIAADMGEISLSDDSGGGAGNKTPPQNSGLKINASTKPEPYRGGLDIRGDNGQLLEPTFTVGKVPPPVNSMDREVTFPGALPVLDWKTGKRTPEGAVIRVWTRPSVLYAHLFATLGDFARGVETILLSVGIFFTLIVLIALIIGMRMTRTMTGAVAQLYDATKHVDRGDFSHRIPVKSADQLAQLSLSFNSMTESIEKLILEQKEKQRLEGELAIAQEVQAQLFPRQVTELESLEVHGFCRPARTVSGDYYDFLTASSHKLILAVGDISGKGISAALLMATIHSAVRAYSVESLPQMRETMSRESMARELMSRESISRELMSREPVAVGAAAGAGRIMAAWPEGIEISPGALLGLLNHQLYESTPPEKYATLFLGIYDGRSHRLTYSNGGHLPPILIARDGTVRRLEAGGTVIGLFDHMTYDEGAVEMHPGEILLAYSDGVTEPENDFGEFGEERLIDLVSANRRLPLLQISQTVTSAVDDWIGDNEQPDDITLVLARAR